MKVQPGMVIPFGTEGFGFTIVINGVVFTCATAFGSAVIAKQEMRRTVNELQSNSSELPA